MKKIIFILLLFFSLQSFPQSYRYAFISGPQIGNANSSENLMKIISDINSNEEVSFIIIAGNITKNGTDKELDSAEQIFSNLKKPYFVIPGSRDIGNQDLVHFKELFHDNKFLCKKDNDVHIGINSCTDWNSKGHIYPEELKWLENILRDSVKNENVIFYSYYSLNNSIDNWFKVTNILRNYNIKASFACEGEPNRLVNINGIPSAAANQEISKFPNYFLIESSRDSLIVSLITAVSKKPGKVLGVISKAKSYEIPKTDSLQFIDYGNNLLWKDELNASIPSSITISGDKVFAAEKNGTVICYDLKGSKLWSYETGETIVSRPAVSGDILSAATLEGDLFTINVNSGQVIQVIGIGEPLISEPVIIDAVNQDEKTMGVVVSSSIGAVYCYDIHTLENIWQNNSIKGVFKTKPLYIKDRIIFGSTDGYLYCLDAKSGILNWKLKERNLSVSLSECIPVSDGKNVYITIPGNYLYAVDLLLGTITWKTNLKDAWESLAISNDKEKLYIKGEKNFHIVSSKTGKQIKEIKMNYGEDQSSIKPVEWNNKIIFGEGNGNIYLIDQKYDWKKLIFAGTAGLTDIIHIKDNVFGVSNVDGKIVLFNVN